MNFDKLKTIFKKKKADIKFKNAGEGHRLCDDTRSSLNCKNEIKPQSSRGPPTESMIRAGEAALLRDINKKESKVKSPRLPADNTIKEEYNRTKEELEKAYEFRDRATIKEITVDKPNQLSKVYFYCPEILSNLDIGSYADIEARIIEYLHKAQSENMLQASSLLIHCANKNQASIDSCISIIRTLLQNIIKDPTETKYHKIRLTNDKIRANIVEVVGAMDFLKGVGFEEQDLPKQDTSNETDLFMVIPPDKCLPNILGDSLDILENSEPIKPILYRNTRSYHKNKLAKINDDNLSQEFFRMSLSDIKRQAELNKQKIEESGMLLTKNMRENIKKLDKRKYRYVLIRILFPDNIVLEGTFDANETLGDVQAWIMSCLREPCSFYLSIPPVVRRVTDFSQSLVDADLAPCSTVRLNFDNSQLNENNSSSAENIETSDCSVFLIDDFTLSD